MIEKFIPIEVNNNPDSNNWYMDISNLSLSELLTLKNELKGTVSFRALDSVIYELSSFTKDEYHALTKRDYLRNKELYLKNKKHSRNRHKGR